MTRINVSAIVLINLLLLTMAIRVNCVNRTDVGVDDRCDDAARDRAKRAALIFPINSATGILVAIAVPVIIPHRNVFVSYNFEANYNMPTIATDVTQGVLTRFDKIPEPSSTGRKGNAKDDFETDDTNSNSTSAGDCNPGVSARKIMPNLITRKKIYGILINKLNSEGFNGKKCLLRSICEASDVPLHQHNGVLGSVLHVILTPSASKNESLPEEFQNAEDWGRKGDCKRYEKRCEHSVLDIISKVVYT